MNPLFCLAGNLHTSSSQGGKWRLYADRRQLTAVTAQNVLCAFHMLYSEDSSNKRVSLPLALKQDPKGFNCYFLAHLSASAVHKLAM